MTPWAAILAAAALGIQTSISPCPLATNIAAVSFIARGVGNSRRVLLSGALYALGRTVTYVGLAVLILWLMKGQLAESSGVARALQQYGPIVLGPVLILLGMLLLGLLGSGASLSLGGAKLQARAAAGGAWWAGLLGILFALSFCPVSAGLFFFALIPLAAQQESLVLLPAVFGVGTAVPVIAFACLMAFAAQLVGRAFHRLTQIERIVRIAAGVLFIGVGIWYCLKYIYGLPLPF
jgi:cytochrome c biogenesis protein CcdA